MAHRLAVGSSTDFNLMLLAQRTLINSSLADVAVIIQIGAGRRAGWSATQTESRAGGLRLARLMPREASNYTCPPVRSSSAGTVLENQSISDFVRSLPSAHGLGGQRSPFRSSCPSPPGCRSRGFLAGALSTEAWAPLHSPSGVRAHTAPRVGPSPSCNLSPPPSKLFMT